MSENLIDDKDNSQVEDVKDDIKEIKEEIRQEKKDEKENKKEEREKAKEDKKREKEQRKAEKKHEKLQMKIEKLHRKYHNNDGADDEYVDAPEFPPFDESHVNEGIRLESESESQQSIDISTVRSDVQFSMWANTSEEQE
ncbi:hypothetical protein M9Y10_030399 [Tritrichomonas musculus]|uniref:Uncharacterized protein n=1 Tax=Tritrichomonas musculus TaxID=1915356 RepID=A0ABR2H3A0_9EUKA